MFYGRRRYERETICLSCSLYEEPREGWRGESPYRRDCSIADMRFSGERRRCACGRAMRLVGRFLGRLDVVYCSDACLREGRNAKRRVGNRDTIPCAVCGEMFEPTRSDAKTCGNRCRQKAFRAARAGIELKRG